MVKALIGAAVALVLVIGGVWMFFPPSETSEIVPVARLSGSAAQQPPPRVETTALNGARPIDPPMTEENVEPTKDEPSNDDSTSAAPAVATADSSAVSVDLTDHYQMQAANFDKITQYPWPAAPRGSQTFANVPLEIGGAIMLWGENNSKRGMNFPEQIAGVPLNQKFETLYVCQGCFFEGPPGTPVCEVVFHYDDGTSAADTIVCGVDSRDWYANPAQVPLGPTGPRSTLAWTGEGKSGDRPQAIRFCLTAIANPHSDKEVTAVDFVSSKSQTAACILAVTVGKSSLMKPTEESPAAEAGDP
jgi:hypothetical protein